MFNSLYYKPMNHIIFLLVSMCVLSCGTPKMDHSAKYDVIDTTQIPPVILGNAQLDMYLPLLVGKKVGVVANHTAMIGDKHLVDVLLNNKIQVLKIFAPEHGFRGNLDRGQNFNDSIDPATGIPVLALYGNKSKDALAKIADLDVLIFDIQDVGARFFTYISTMHDVMNVCAKLNKQFIVLDRPNPLGDYVAGPIRKECCKSHVGMHAIPIVHGLTIGELAQMINGEKWLDNGAQCNLKVIPVKYYTHLTKYEPVQKPSPNLPNYLAIRLYPSLCLFEATEISIGRGTLFPFQVIGFPDQRLGAFTFTPQGIEGMELNPVHKGILCYGIDLRNSDANVKFTLKYFIDFYKASSSKEKFISRSKWFNLLSGNEELQKQIISGMTEQDIVNSWKPELDLYKLMRKKYLLYNDFE